MNPKKLAEAYRTLSMGYAELADAYLDEPEVAAADVQKSKENFRRAVGFEDSPFDLGLDRIEFR